MTWGWRPISHILRVRQFLKDELLVPPEHVFHKDLHFSPTDTLIFQAFLHQPLADLEQEGVVDVDEEVDAAGVDVEGFGSQLEVGWVLEAEEGELGLSKLDVVGWLCVLVVEH